MRWIVLLGCLVCLQGYGQLKDYTIGPKGDTLNGVDQQGKKQGKWVLRYDEIRGEPGYEEEGEFKNDRREGPWRKYTLQSDLFGIENYHWGLKDGICQYYNMNGDLVKEESWRALNPDKPYDTLDVEDPNLPGTFKKVIVKNEGSSLRDGYWKLYDAGGSVIKTEFWQLGKLEDSNSAAAVKKPGADSLSAARTKPKEVEDFEKKNAGRKKVKVRDGSTGN